MHSRTRVDESLKASRGEVQDVRGGFVHMHGRAESAAERPTREPSRVTSAAGPPRLHTLRYLPGKHLHGGRNVTADDKPHSGVTDVFPSRREEGGGG